MRACGAERAAEVGHAVDGDLSRSALVFPQHVGACAQGQRERRPGTRREPLHAAHLSVCARQTVIPVRARSGYLVLAAAFVALAALMIVYVSGDDGYYLDGSSRWDSREEHLITVVAIAACALAAAVGAWCSTRARRRRWAGWLAVAVPAAAVVLWVAAYIANTAN
jgi:hypothetical protein